MEIVRRTSDQGGIGDQHLGRMLRQMRTDLIPGLLRAASSISEEDDLEVLLDGCGYAVSFVAEELLGVIDDCLQSSWCDSEDIRLIRELYSTLAGYAGGDPGRTVPRRPSLRGVRNPRPGAAVFDISSPRRAYA